MSIITIWTFVFLFALCGSKKYMKICVSIFSHLNGKLRWSFRVEIFKNFFLGKLKVQLSCPSAYLFWFIDFLVVWWFNFYGFLCLNGTTFCYRYLNWIVASSILGYFTLPLFSRTVLKEVRERFIALNFLSILFLSFNERSRTLIRAKNMCCWYIHNIPRTGAAPSTWSRKLDALRENLTVCQLLSLRTPCPPNKFYRREKKHYEDFINKTTK